MNRGVYILTVFIIALAAATAMAQEWGEMQYIGEGPFGPPGTFNPSYCDSDSMIYFDNFLRIHFVYGEIWESPMVGGYVSDPSPMPYPINLPDQPEIINAMPHIFAGGDTLLFCSDREGTYGGLDIWMSVKDDTCWGEPVNLGDSVNSELDELAPYYAAGINTLFFDRLEQRINFHFGLYRSISIDSSDWHNAERLPEIINPLDYGGFDPTFDESTNALYFNLSWVIYKSVYENDNWSEPEILGDNVNGLWFPNYCNLAETHGAFISYDGNRLYYSKWIWEASLCIDFTAALFLSERVNAIDESPDEPLNYDLALTAYPNPFNSTTTISYSNLDGDDIEIYDITGRLVKTLSIGNESSGIVTWEATDSGGRLVCSGVYFVKAQTSKGIQTAKLIYLK